MKNFRDMCPQPKLHFFHDNRLRTSAERQKIDFIVSTPKVAWIKIGNVLIIVFHSLQLQRSLLLHKVDPELLLINGCSKKEVLNYCTMQYVVEY